MMIEPFSMSWYDITNLPASVVSILAEEAERYGKTIKQKFKKK